MEKKILIVDDDETTRQLLITCLEKEGFNIIAAHNGTEALGAYLYATHTKPFSLIILDVVMPPPDGLTVLETIRKEETLRGVPYGEGVPIIMLTGHKNTCMESFNKGCDDYMIKPVNLNELVKTIRGKIK